MCKLCEKNPVYEFTNKRKLCKNCFIIYFDKKILYTIRKFSMINKEDTVGYKKENSFKWVVLEHVLKFVQEKANFELVKLPNKRAGKIASDSSLDSESEGVIRALIDGNASELKKYLPIHGNIIKPLYLFLEEEILLYAKLKGLKFKQQKERKDKIKIFADEFEKKHPEVKRAIMNGILELYNK